MGIATRLNHMEWLLWRPLVSLVRTASGTSRMVVYAVASILHADRRGVSERVCVFWVFVIALTHPSKFGKAEMLTASRLHEASEREHDSHVDILERHIEARLSALSSHRLSTQAVGQSGEFADSAPCVTSPRLGQRTSGDTDNTAAKLQSLASTRLAYTPYSIVRCQLHFTKIA